MSSLKPRNIFHIQPIPDPNPSLPWNLSLEKCQQGFTHDDLANIPSEQPTFTSLPISLRAPFKGYYPPVFHFGFVYTEEKLKHLCETHILSPKIRPDPFCFLNVIQSIMQKGHMRVSAPTGMDGDNDMIRLFSVATNYWPWVEKDTMEQILRLLGNDLGPPRWFVDPLYAHWNKGPFLDDGIPILRSKHPWKYYENLMPGGPRIHIC